MLHDLRELGGKSRRDVIVAFAALTALLAAHTMLETARDALFLSAMPAERLPIAYLAMAAAVAVTTRLNTWACRRLPRRIVLTSTLVVGAGVTVLFWPLTETGSYEAFFGLYVWPGVLTTTALVQLWLRLYDVLDVERAKRLYAAIGAGGMLGAFLGAAAASGLIELVPGRGLLVGAAGLYALAGLLALRLSSGRRAPSVPPEAPGVTERAPDTSPRALARDSYARRLVALMFAMAVATTVVDYLFKWQVAMTIEASDLAQFFARFYAIINVMALGAQILLLPLLLRRWDVHHAVLMLPCALLIVSLGAAVLPALATMLVLRGMDGMLRHSMFGTASEIFYLPLRGAVRDRLKGLVAAVGQRGGQAAASLAILGTNALPLGPRAPGLVLIVLAAGVSAWLVFVLRRGYVDRFRARLRERVLDTRGERPELDVESLESLLTSLSSPKVDEVLAAIDLLHMYEKDRVVPPLILHHRSEAVVLRALELYASRRRAEVKPLLSMLLARPESTVVAAALRTACAYGRATTSRALAQCGNDDRAEVRATRAIARLRLTPSRAGARRVAALVQESEETRIGLARAVTLLPRDVQAKTAQALVACGNERTRIELARSIAASPLPEHFEVLLELLKHPSTRARARGALGALDEPRTLERLEQAFVDPETDQSIRLHVPRSISLFRSARASRFLSLRLPEERDERVAFKILRGLGRMRADNPRLPIDHSALRLVARRTIERGLDILRWRRAIERAIAALPALDTAGARFVVALLDERLERNVERSFRILHVLMPRAGFWIIHAGCFDQDSRVRAASHELLRHSLSSGLRKPMLALLEERPERVEANGPPRDAAARRLDVALEGDDPREVHDAYLELIGALSALPDVALAGVARSHGAELRWRVTRATPPEDTVLLDGMMDRLAIHVRRSSSRLSQQEVLG